jgi:hypothetical protein
MFSPTKGINAELSFNYSAKWLGSSDNYATMYSTFTLLPRFELNFQSSLFWADESLNTSQFLKKTL